MLRFVPDITNLIISYAGCIKDGQCLVAEGKTYWYKKQLCPYNCEPLLCKRCGLFTINQWYYHDLNGHNLCKYCNKRRAALSDDELFKRRKRGLSINYQYKPISKFFI